MEIASALPESAADFQAHLNHACTELAVVDSANDFAEYILRSMERSVLVAAKVYDALSGTEEAADNAHLAVQRAVMDEWDKLVHLQLFRVNYFDAWYVSSFREVLKEGITTILQLKTLMRSVKDGMEVQAARLDAGQHMKQLHLELSALKGFGSVLWRARAQADMLRSIL